MSTDKPNNMKFITTESHVMSVWVCVGVSVSKHKTESQIVRKFEHS